MHSILSLLLVYAVFLGAMISPGPDLLISMRNALGYSARAGVFTALGIMIGNSIHISYCLAGIGLLISKSVILFNIIKWAGAAYLIYIGLASLRSPGMSIDVNKVTENLHHKIKSDALAFRNGFVTNITNPKATMFFLALFSQMIDPSIPFGAQAALGAACVITSFFWFSGVALVMGHVRIRQAYSRASKWIDRIFGGFFIALGAKLAFARLAS